MVFLRKPVWTVSRKPVWTVSFLCLSDVFRCIEVSKLVGLRHLKRKIHDTFAEICWEFILFTSLSFWYDLIQVLLCMLKSMSLGADMLKHDCELVVGGASTCRAYAPVYDSTSSFFCTDQQNFLSGITRYVVLGSYNTRLDSILWFSWLPWTAVERGTQLTWLPAIVGSVISLYPDYEQNRENAILLY